MGEVGGVTVKQQIPITTACVVPPPVFQPVFIFRQPRIRILHLSICAPLSLI
jgi:hypothetical protein